MRSAGSVPADDAVGADRTLRPRWCAGRDRGAGERARGARRRPGGGGAGEPTVVDAGACPDRRRSARPPWRREGGDASVRRAALRVVGAERHPREDLGCAQRVRLAFTVVIASLLERASRASTMRQAAGSDWRHAPELAPDRRASPPLRSTPTRPERSAPARRRSDSGEPSSSRRPRDRRAARAVHGGGHRASAWPVLSAQALDPDEGRSCRRRLRRAPGRRRTTTDRYRFAAAPARRRSPRHRALSLAGRDLSDG
jgi:hypothetical protein